MRNDEQCAICGGNGWLLMAPDGDYEALEIQRCDTCMQFNSDGEARQMVAAVLHQDGTVCFHEWRETAD